jgi:tetratricopeptide (TPR) repeat protein
MFNFLRKRETEDLPARYLKLAHAEQWPQALPLIEQIVRSAPQIPTSWFNYGVCLSALGREREAADAFLESYRLNPTDFGAQFRIFRSLHLAGDFAALLDFAQRERTKHPEIVEALREHFPKLFDRPEFAALRDSM